MSVEVLNSLILVVHALPQCRVKRLSVGFFALYPRAKKSAEVAGQVGENLPRHVSLGSGGLDSAATRFGAGFRPWRVCTRFLEFQMGRHVQGCAYDRCTFAHSWAELHPEASAHENELVVLQCFRRWRQRGRLGRRRRSAVLQVLFINQVVDVLMQLKFQQSKVHRFF